MPNPQRSATLVGRGAELATARRMVDSAHDGDGGVLLVTGEAGIGKSRLLEETARNAAQRGMVVLSGRSVEGGGAYRALAQALLGQLRDERLTAYAETAQLRPYRAALARLVPGWAAGSEDPEPSVDPVLVTGEGLLRLLRTIGGEHGCLVRLEDLHWSDADTVALLGYLAETLAGSPVLLALSARTDLPAPNVVSPLLSHPGITTLPLGRLSAEDVTALAEALAGGSPVPDDLHDFLVEKSEGLPFLVEELLAGRAEPGDQHGAIPLPPTLAALVSTRLARLASDERLTVEAAAVLGSELDVATLAEVTGQAENRVVTALRRATDVHLLAPDPAQLRWRHALTREAVLAGLLPPERARLARRGAEVVRRKARTPEDEALAAELLAAAGDGDAAAAALLDLARNDIARGALRSADELLARALATGRCGPEVSIEQVRLLTLTGKAAEALDAGTAVLASVTGDAHAELCLQLARTAINAGRWAEADRYVERAGRPDDPRSIVIAADSAYGSGRAGEAARIAADAVTRSEQLDQPESLCQALSVVGRYLGQTDPPAAIAAFGRAAQVAAERGLTPRRIEALVGLGLIELLDDKDTALVEAQELAIDAGMLGLHASIELILSERLVLHAGWRAAEPVARGVAERCARLRLPGQQAMAEVVVAAGRAAAGDWASAQDLLAAAVSRPDNQPEVSAFAACVTGFPSLFAHDLERANELTDAGVSVLLDYGSSAPLSYWGLWVVLRTAVADRDGAAREWLRSAPAVLRSANRGGLAYADAIAAGRAGDGKRANALLAEGDTLLAEQHWWRRMLRLMVLEAAVVDGWGDPVPALRADLAGHEHAGEEQLARTCRDLLRRAGAPTRRGRGSSAVPARLRALGVTSREMDVLALVAEGLSNAEVAQRLFLSSRTVETHVASLLAKTGTSGRLELSRWVSAQTR